MSALRRIIEENDKRCRQELEYDAYGNEEAKLIKRACAELKNSYPYLIAYEYEHYGHYKGDAILCSHVGFFGSVDILVLEAKHLNYTTANWQNQKDKLKILDCQIEKCPRIAIHYLKNYCVGFDMDSIGNIYTCKVFNDRNDIIVKETKLIGPYNSGAMLDKAPTAVQENENQGYGWGTWALGAALIGAALLKK